MQSSLRLIIEPKRGWQFIDWQELWRYRDLIYFLVWRDIKARYAQSVLGLSWAIIRPLFSMIVFSVVFGTLADIPSDGIPYPIFSYTALVPWTYFAGSLTAATGSIVGNSMLSKVYFPRLIVPMTAVLANLVDFVVAFALVVVLMIWFHIPPTSNVVFLPLLVILMVLTASGLGMWLSSLAIQYRDVNYAIGFVVQLLMYTAPVVWPVSLIPEQYHLLYGIYPIAGVIEGFRAALLGASPMPWDLIAVGSISATTIWLSGALYFRFKERIFADIF